MWTELSKLAAGFADRPIVRGRQMRDLLEQSPRDFCEAAVRILGGDAEERVQRYLVALLWTNNLLIPCLTGPATSSGKAEQIAALASRVDPRLPAKLVGFVLDTSETESPECIERILTILRSIPNASGFRPLLTPLLRHQNARIRAKVALLVGEGNQNRTWFERRMLEGDARVRANAIESAGRRVSEDLRPLFRSAALDENNRVAGNALIALYRLGETKAISGLHEMIFRPEPAFRATAAWAMGETGDTRFLPLLGRILGDPGETIKSATFRAIRKLRNRNGRAARSLDVRILSEPQRDDSAVEIEFAVCDRCGPVQELPATAVQVLINGDFVYSYIVSEFDHKGRIASAFLLPARCGSERESARPSLELLVQCHEFRRRGGPWIISKYSRADDASRSARPATLFGVRFDGVEDDGTRIADTAEELVAAIEGSDNERGPDFATAFTTLCESLRSKRGSAHLFLLDPEIPSKVDWLQLHSMARTTHMTVHAVGGTYKDCVGELCSSTGGFYSTGPGAFATLPIFYRGLFHRYRARVTVEPGIQINQVQIAVRHMSAAGESEEIRMRRQE